MLLILEDVSARHKRRKIETMAAKTNATNVSGNVTMDTEKSKLYKYTVYKVGVTNSANTWFMFRRYNEFHNLRDKLKEKYPDIPLKFPGKKLFGNLDPTFLDRRKSGLDTFVAQILVQPRLIENEYVREFFQLDRYKPPTPPPSQSSKDEGEENGDEEGGDEGEHLNLGPSEKSSARPSDFDYLKVIGKGSFGKVYLARHKKEEMEYAVKVLHKAQIKRRNEVRHIMSERNVLVKNIKHPFLVEVHYSFQTRQKLYFVLTYVNGGELFFHLQREKTFNESRARFYSAEIASALGYLHENNIIYRDLKPENLLLDRTGHVVLTDFGLCKEGIIGKQTTSTFCGTPEYLAPEVIRKQPYDRTVDWWCLGSVLYEMLFGLPPFYSRDHKEMYEKILYQPLRVRNTVSQPAKDVLSAMLQKDRTLRLGSKTDFPEIEQHPFFFEIDWKKLNKRKLTPPFDPKVPGPYDLKNIDREFLQIPVGESVGKSLAASVHGPDTEFAGFTYVPRTMEDIGEEF